MKKGRIAFKLSACFLCCLLVFCAAIGGIFMTLFRSHTVALHQSELEERAKNIAGTLSGWMSTGAGLQGAGGKHMGEESGHMGEGSGYGAYLRFLDEIAMADVWLVDENKELLTVGHMDNVTYHYTDLPAGADRVIDAVLEGEVTFSETFSPLLDAPALTVGAPIRDSSGKVLGAVLLHSPVDGMDSAVRDGGTSLLISMAIALGISLLLAVLLSQLITRPLKKMNRNALCLADGDYTVKNGLPPKDEIGQLAHSLDILADRLREADRQKERLDQLRRDFISNISHELRTPVTVIRGSLEALCDGVVEDPGRVRDYHEQMLAESKSLERLISDLLDLSRLQNPDFGIEMSSVSLQALLDDAARSARQIAAEKGVELRLQKEEATRVVEADYGRLRQLLLILLDNAVKFSPEGGAVELTQEKDAVTVRDHGPGIDENDLPRLFDRFFQSDAGQKKSGSGLGLAIASQIAERHGFSLTAKNAEGGGAQFTLRL